ncbi:MAG TPA: hypothetical protein VHS99_02360 [Chloroflexota bacterium]|jgi:hypothetical protein|nr:hypothetical protein [Chloroflexota bacterium]
MAELELWMRVGQPLEPVLADYDRILDAWQAGGVRGLVVGRLDFVADDAGGADPEAGPAQPVSWGGGRPGTVAAYAPNHTVYRRWGVEPPPDPPQAFPERRERLVQLLESAKRRGWQVYLFEPAAGAGPPAPDASGAGGPLITDEGRRRAYLARLEDALTQFPQADGAILDGPEWGYELKPGHRANLFDDLPPAVEPAAQALGFDYARLVAAKDRLAQRLHQLNREVATLNGPGGLFAGLSLIGYDPGVVSWFTFRARALTTFFKHTHALTEALTRARGRQVKLGIGPRMPAFSALCGYDFPAIAPMFDLILPKLYFWHRGFDGLYGTVSRYVETLMDWNPGLWEPEAFAAVRALLGITLPSTDPSALPGQTMASLRELEGGFPDAFFREVVTGEVRRSIAAADGYPWKVLPWVDSGRRPHGGDPVTAADLRRLLRAAKDGGARYVLYHNHGHLTAAEWSVLSDFCGSSWRAGQGLYGRYLPPDS